MSKHWWKILLVLLAILVVFRVPALVRLIWWLLPLGSGFDDLVEIVVLVLIFILLFAKFWTSIPGWLRKR